MIADIADALLPVSFVMALGFLAGKRRIIDNRNVGSINSLVMGLAGVLRWFIPRRSCAT
jgi:malonate transporter